MTLAASPGNGNLLLDLVPPGLTDAFEIRPEFHPIGTVLIAADEISDSIFFPLTGAVASIVRSTRSGSMVESGVVGNEGLFHIQDMITGPSPSGTEAIVQNEGTFVRMTGSLARAGFADNPDFRDRVLSFTALFLDQITQNLVCNRLHPIEERLAKWLLVMRDRMVGNELHLTHDFLSHMLGIHRPGVSIAVAALEIDGLIQHRRNRISIIDHAGLMERSCECFEAIHEGLIRFTGATRAVPDRYASVPTPAPTVV